VHFGAIHLLFNMFWVYDLGGMIEARQGTGRLLLLVLTAAVLSNLGQYIMSGPLFGGMSGVVYALFGYVWMKSRYEASADLYVQPQTVLIMIGWLFLCMTGRVGPIANTAHGVGLAVGVAVGVAPYLWRRLLRG
jgi:GlpG protein